MRAAVQYIFSRTCKPVLTRYLSRTRNYSFAGIRLEIPAGVFHPGFFFSTKMLLRYIAKTTLKETKLLELGAGSGLLSIYAAKKGATVLATDISPAAIACLARNRAMNNVSFEILQSDLFDKISPQPFDRILINPPYYKKNPGSYKEYAWYCGENGEYFQKLFGQLHEYLHAQTEVLMVLCSGCDIAMIHTIAALNQLEMYCVRAVNKLIEDNYIFKIVHSVEQVTNKSKLPDQGFGKLYNAVRSAEKRLYTDEELLQLPVVGPQHPHYAEWRIRKNSSEKLVTYLYKKKQSLKILEVGCGNGWLSHQLADQLPAGVTGIDPHQQEIAQAKRVFSYLPGLRFIQGDAMHNTWAEERFDVIVFAASVQYFSSLQQVLQKMIALLNPGGEIHIIDTPFYATKAIAAAKQRSADYFQQLGFEEMSGHYHHHSLAELTVYDHQLLVDPRSLKNKLFNKKNPFYWVRIQPKQ